MKGSPDRGEEDFTALFEMSLDMLCIADIHQAAFLRVNPAFTEILGFFQEELVGKSILEWIHPEDVEPTRTVIETRLQRGVKVFNFQNRFRCKDGEYKWLNWVLRPVPERGIAFAVAHDITEEKNSAARQVELVDTLRETSELLNTLLDAIPDVIGLQDAQHKILRYNKAGYQFLGLSPSDLHGQRCYELIGHGEPCKICATSEVYRTKSNAGVEKYVEELDRWLDVRAYPILDSSGEIVQVVEHLRDITHEKMAEAELKRAHETLLMILDSMDAHVYVKDFDTRQILFTNKKVRDDFDWDFVGFPCNQAFRDRKDPCEDCVCKDLLDEKGHPQGGKVWEDKSALNGAWYRNYDRAIVWVDDRIVQLRIATDITDQKRHEEYRTIMEQQMRQASKFEAIGTLAGGIAHDFNNLLMGIQGRTSLVMMEMDRSDPMWEDLAAIEQYIRSAANLTKQLLGFARGGKYEARPMDVNELVQSTSTLFGRTRKDIQIQKRFQSPVLVVEADRNQIEQVLLNMYVNAWQAMPQGGQLVLDTDRVRLEEEACKVLGTKEGWFARISVTDTGDGMDEATRERVFDPFFSTRKTEHGTGLGLASAYGIVRNHGGMITVYSELGKGSRFEVYLPLSERFPIPEKAHQDKIWKGSGTILLVDDEKSVLDVAQKMLRKLGYNVLVALGGEDAVEQVRQKKEEIDLMLLDLVMPGMSGSNTFDAIRAIRKDLPVLLASGYATGREVEDILDRGAVGFIQKPFTVAELSDKIRSVLS